MPLCIYYLPHIIDIDASGLFKKCDLTLRINADCREVNNTNRY